MFKKVVALRSPADETDNPQELVQSRRVSIVELATRRQARRVELDDEYECTLWVAPTSNVVERFFSRCKQVLSDYRSRLTDEHFEGVMLLKMNSQYWNVSLMRKALA